MTGCLNYAALHESFRLGDLLSTEPHETIAEFVDGVAELDGPVLLKGFTSLSNVHVCLKSIWHLRRVRNRVIMIREIDASDLWNFPVVDDYYGDYFANDGLSNIAVLDGASLVYFLNAGLRMGYRSITLVGFDDNQYFFDEEDAGQHGGDNAQATHQAHTELGRFPDTQGQPDHQTGGSERMRHPILQVARQHPASR